MLQYQNYVLFFDYNLSGGELSCACCGVNNHRYDRVDTEDIFGVEESFCILCWWKHIVEISHICQAKTSLDSLN